MSQENSVQYNSPMVHLDDRYTIVLFYKFVRIDNPDSYREEFRILCQRHNLLGRVLLAAEGINGTLEGLNEDIDAFWQEWLQDDRFADTDRKTSWGTGHAFPKLSIKVKPELVSTKLSEHDDYFPGEHTAHHIEPSVLHEWFESGEDFEVLDLRNDYEHDIGHFQGSYLPNMKTFRDLPQVADEIAQKKDKKIVMVCTGGIRCEKGSGYLLNQGFENVYQLRGGIHRYIEQYPDGYWRGGLYVFDGRVVMDCDGGQHEVIAECMKCKTKSEIVADCANLDCHRQYITCVDCLDDQGRAFCSHECTKATNIQKENKRAYNKIQTSTLSSLTNEA